MTVSATLVGFGAATAGSVAVVISDLPTPSEAVLWAAGLATALGVLWRFLHLGEIIKGTRAFLKDYNGEPARPGVKARPGMPEQLGQQGERLAKIEQHVAQLPQLVESAARNAEELEKVNQRITEHRRRNEDQALLLRQELDARAHTLEAQLQARNAEVDQRLEHLSEDLMRAEVYRSSLVEVHGIDIPPKRQGTNKE